MQIDHSDGHAESRDVRHGLSGHIWTAAFFSLFLNLLTLTGPIFMLQTYDRVLSARSEPTLIALMLIVTFLFAMLGLLDWARQRLMTRLGWQFQARLDRGIFQATIDHSVVQTRPRQATDASQPLRDVEALRNFYASPVFAALFDAPFAPLFLIGLGFFHPLIGIFAFVGGLILVLSAVANQLMTRVSAVKAAVASHESDRYSDQIRNEAETIHSLGMQSNAFARWDETRSNALQHSLRAIDLGGNFATLSRVFRLFLQSAMLGLGAWLVLRGEITAGVMIASSILLARALSPVESLVNQ
ncbi:ABC transporter transmembrane region [Loktanella fryxellensis]|uniref:ABC transporter transmembrane region n=2 Tax=Loktanella fryxellensis TaxID=245187 RepID=A0A1H8DHL5_9RHOB|nr:ABC transporter transmembrane region [Loktanella fryxellensis]